MMLKCFEIVLLVIIPLGCAGQQKIADSELTLVGKYTSNNVSHHSRAHYEELNLNADSTFSYRAQIGHFVHINKTGKWTVLDQSIVLNENSKYSEKIVVNESLNSIIPTGSLKFNVKYFDGTPFNYSIAATIGDTTLILKNQFSSSLLKLSGVDYVLVESGLLSYPVYTVKSAEANEFDISVTPERVFLNEQWKIEKEGVIRPVYLDNRPAGYVLTKAQQ